MGSNDAASVLTNLVEQAREAPGLGALTHLQDGTTLGVELNRGLTFFFIDDVEATTGEALAAVEGLENDPIREPEGTRGGPRMG